MSETKETIKEECFYILSVTHRKELGMYDIESLQESCINLMECLQKLKESV